MSVKSVKETAVQENIIDRELSEQELEAVAGAGFFRPFVPVVPVVPVVPGKFGFGGFGHGGFGFF